MIRICPVPWAIPCAQLADQLYNLAEQNSKALEIQSYIIRRNTVLLTLGKSFLS